MNSSCEEIADCCEDALVSETEAEICSMATFSSLTYPTLTSICAPA